MADLAGLSVSASVFILVLPLVWWVCDRRCTLSRLVITPPTSSGAPVVFADVIEFLQAVARASQSGATAATALCSAPPSSAGVARAQEQLRAGVALHDVLDHHCDELRIVASCLHHGTLSVPALRHAIDLLRHQTDMEAQVRTARALAHRSAVILTALPFGLLALASLVSGSVRRSLLEPLPLLAISVGAVANRAGFAWMSGGSRSVAVEHSRHDPMLRVCGDIAAHLRAGGTTASAFAHLAVHNAVCAEVHDRLVRGESLRDALAPLHQLSPQLADVIHAAHTDGLPLAPAIESLVNDLVNARDAKVKEMVAELPARSTTPLVLLVLPSFLLLAVAPLALAALRGLSLPQL